MDPISRSAYAFCQGLLGADRMLDARHWVGFAGIDPFQFTSGT